MQRSGRAQVSGDAEGRRGARQRPRAPRLGQRVTFSVPLSVPLSGLPNGLPAVGPGPPPTVDPDQPPTVDPDQPPTGGLTWLINKVEIRERSAFADFFESLTAEQRATWGAPPRGEAERK